MSDLRNRITALERRTVTDDAETMAAVLRYAGGSSVTAAIERLGRERGAPLLLSAAFLERAERTAGRIETFVTALDVLDGRTPQENA